MWKNDRLWNLSVLSTELWISACLWILLLPSSSGTCQKCQYVDLEIHHSVLFSINFHVTLA